MLNFIRIVGLGLLTTSCLLSLASCGQKGALTFPTESAAQNRATLPQVLNPASPATPAASAPKR